MADDQSVIPPRSLPPLSHPLIFVVRYDTSLSLGFGRPYAMPLVHSDPRQYLAVARKLGPSAQIDLPVAAYVTSLVELSAVSLCLYNYPSVCSTRRLTVSTTDNNRFDLGSAHRSFTTNFPSRYLPACCRCLEQDSGPHVRAEPALGRVATSMDMEW